MSENKKPAEDRPKAEPEVRDYAEYDFDTSIMEHEGFSVGDMIVLIADDPGEMYYEGEEGQVLGFSVIDPPSDPAMAAAFGNSPDGRTAIYVLMDGTDEPIEVKPEHMEVV